ncbi:MAG TPA: tetratricopeptide repeat protein [Terracidiphilus sp.]|nr:tetratricopeptide repeat protein [Terracidiphilus sp.]
MDDLSRNASLPSGVVYRFGLFTLDPAAASLTRGGVKVKLQGQPLQLLALLLEKHGEIVTRDEIRGRLWSSGTFVDFDKSLGVATVKVREALGDHAGNPRFLETVPRRGYRFIAPVSIEFPRNHDAEKNSHAPIEPITLPSPATPSAEPVTPVGAMAAGTRNFKRWPSLWITLAICAFAVAGFFTYRLRHKEQRATTNVLLNPHPELRRSVAVLGFRNLGGAPAQDWISAAFAEMLNTELAASGDMRLVSGEDVATAKHDLSLSPEDTLAKNTLTQLRGHLGADVVVLGSYMLLPAAGKNQIRLDLRAQDTALGETIAEEAVTGDETDLFDLASQAGNKLRERLDPSQTLAPGSDVPSLSGASSQLALQFYSEGRERLFAFDFVGARDFLKRAVAADPKFALAHSALSDTWNHLGNAAEARKEARLALNQSHTLPQEAALVIQGQYQESINDWPAAILTYSTLVQLYPDNLNYGLRLNGAQLHINAKDAMSTLRALRKLPPPIGDDPRIDLAEASTLIGQDLPAARAAAERAIAKASTHGATLMVARGYGILCQQDSSNGVAMQQSVSECNLARSSYIRAGDQNNAARTLNDLAGLYYLRGELGKAEAMWSEAIEDFRKTGEDQGYAAASNNLGDVMLLRGSLDEARKLLETAVVVYQRVGDRTGVALATADLGEIALFKAKIAAARSSYDKAVAIGKEIGDKSSMAYGHTGLGNVLAAQDQLGPAREHYETALKLRKEIGETQTALQSRVALARLALEEHRPAEAESEARICRDAFHKEQLRDDEIAATIVLVEALLAQGRAADAKEALAPARQLQEATENREMQLRFSLIVARLLLAERDQRTARTLLDLISRQSEAVGFVGLSLEVRMTAAEAKRDAGDRSAAQKDFGIVEARSRKAGLFLLARKAGEAARQTSPRPV